MHGKTYVIENVCKHTFYRCCTSPDGIQVIVFIISQGKHYDIYSRINSQRVSGFDKQNFGEGNDNDIQWGNGHARRYR
jgi:hypothetical protein